jgi:hypothetical protein
VPFLRAWDQAARSSSNRGSSSYWMGIGPTGRSTRHPARPRAGVRPCGSCRCAQQAASGSSGGRVFAAPRRSRVNPRGPRPFGVGRRPRRAGRRQAPACRGDDRAERTVLQPFRVVHAFVDLDPFRLISGCPPGPSDSRSRSALGLGKHRLMDRSERSIDNPARDSLQRTRRREGRRRGERGARVARCDATPAERTPASARTAARPPTGSSVEGAIGGRLGRPPAQGLSSRPLGAGRVGFRGRVDRVAFGDAVIGVGVGSSRGRNEGRPHLADHDLDGRGDRKRDEGAGEPGEA